MLNNVPSRRRIRCNVFVATFFEPGILVYRLFSFHRAFDEFCFLAYGKKKPKALNYGPFFAFDLITPTDTAFFFFEGSQYNLLITHLQNYFDF
jgi:hypothetical protein